MGGWSACSIPEREGFLFFFHARLRTIAAHTLVNESKRCPREKDRGGKDGQVVDPYRALERVAQASLGNRHAGPYGGRLFRRVTSADTCHDEGKFLRYQNTRLHRGHIHRDTETPESSLINRLSITILDVRSYKTVAAVARCYTLKRHGTPPKLSQYSCVTDPLVSAFASILGTRDARVPAVTFRSHHPIETAAIGSAASQKPIT
uniref:Uncharacterized protein n=1 Tax=Anopheles maculatus TaxID=74869 RepID=A0A182SDK3_9DIPT